MIGLEKDEKSIEIDPYCCSTKAMVDRHQQLKAVGHILRETSWLVYFFLKEESGQIDGTVHSVNYRPSPIPVGGLEIKLNLNFNSRRYITHIKMKEFLTWLYSFDYVAKITEPSSSDEGARRSICSHRNHQRAAAKWLNQKRRNNLLWLTNHRHEKVIVK